MVLCIVYYIIIHSNKITQKENNNPKIGKICCSVIIVKKKMFSNLWILCVRRTIIRVKYLIHKKISNKKIKLMAMHKKTFTCLASWRNKDDLFTNQDNELIFHVINVIFLLKKGKFRFKKLCIYIYLVQKV